MSLVQKTKDLLGIRRLSDRIEDIEGEVDKHEHVYEFESDGFGAAGRVFDPEEEVIYMGFEEQGEWKCVECDHMVYSRWYSPGSDRVRRPRKSLLTVVEPDDLMLIDHSLDGMALSEAKELFEGDEDEP